MLEIELAFDKTFNSVVVQGTVKKLALHYEK